MKYETPEGFKRYLGDSQTPDVSYRVVNDDEYAAFLKYAQRQESLNPDSGATIMVDKEQTYVIENDFGDRIVAAKATSVEFGEPDNAAESNGMLPPGVKEITVAPVIASYINGTVPLMQGTTQIMSKAWKIQGLPRPVRASTASPEDWNFVDSYLDPETNANLFVDAGNGVRSVVRERIRERNIKIEVPDKDFKIVFDLEDTIQSRALSMPERQVLRDEINKGITNKADERIFVGNAFKVGGFDGHIVIGYYHGIKSTRATLQGYQITHDSKEGELNVRPLNKYDYQDLKVDPKRFGGEVELDKDMVSFVSSTGFARLRNEKGEELINALTNENMNRTGFLESLTSRLGDNAGRFTIQKPSNIDYDKVGLHASKNSGILKEGRPHTTEVVKNTLGGNYVIKDTQTNERFFIGTALVHDKEADVVIKTPLITHIPEDVNNTPDPNKAFEALGLSREGMPLQVIIKADDGTKSMHHASYQTDSSTGEPSYTIDHSKPTFTGDNIPRIRTYRDDGEIEAWIHSDSIKQALNNKHKLDATHTQAQEQAMQDIKPSSKAEADGGARKFVRWQLLMQNARKSLLSDLKQFESSPASKVTDETRAQYNQDKKSLALSIVSPESFSELARNDGKMRSLNPKAINSLLESKEPGEYMGLDTITGAGVVAKSNANNLQNSKAIRQDDLVLASVMVKNYTSDAEHTNLYVVQEPPKSNYYNLQLLAERVDAKGNVLLSGEKALEAIGIDKNSVVPSVSILSSMPESSVKNTQSDFLAQISPSELRKKMNLKQIQQQVQKAGVENNKMTVGADTHVSADVKVPAVSPDIKPHLPQNSRIDRMRTEVYNSASKVFVRTLNDDEIGYLNHMLKRDEEWGSHKAIPITGGAIIKKHFAAGQEIGTFVYRERQGNTIVGKSMTVDELYETLASNDPRKEMRYSSIDNLNLSTRTPASTIGSFAEGMDIMTTALNARKRDVPEEVVIASLTTFASNYVNSQYEKERAETGFRDQSTPNEVQMKLAQLNEMEERQLIPDTTPEQDMIQSLRGSARRL